MESLASCMQNSIHIRIFFLYSEPIDLHFRLMQFKQTKNNLLVG